MTRALDAGWLFLAAGLAVCAAAVLLPARRELDGLERQVRGLEHEQVRLEARLDAYRTFLDAMGRRDPDLVRRLAATGLNAMPEDAVPLLVTRDDSASVVGWIESSAVGAPSESPPPRPPSTLERLVLGPARLWMIAGGALSVFIGIILTPSLSARRHGIGAGREPRVERPRPIDAHLAGARPACAVLAVVPRPHRPAWPMVEDDAAAPGVEFDAVDVADERVEAGGAFAPGEQLDLGFTSAAEAAARLRGAAGDDAGEGADAGASAPRDEAGNDFDHTWDELDPDEDELDEDEEDEDEIEDVDDEADEEDDEEKEDDDDDDEEEDDEDWDEDEEEDEDEWDEDDDAEDDVADDDDDEWDEDGEDEEEEDEPEGDEARR